MKVFIVEDSEVVRERLKAMLTEITEIEIIGEAENNIDATDLIKKLKPDAVILDIRLSSGSGIEVLQDIKKEKPAPLVIMLTNYPYPQYRKKCMGVGADFFFDKSTEFNKITEVLKKNISQIPESKIG